MLEINYISINNINDFFTTEIIEFLYSVSYYIYLKIFIFIPSLKL